MLLRLAGPMQAWGTSSRFTRRMTDREPSKSAILGLIAAAEGRRRVDSIEDLLGLAFAVRIDQRGAVERDFQTARSLDGRESMPLSHRYYLSDAVFVAAVSGDDDLIEGIAAAVHRPAFPLYLGRRAFAPAFPLLLGTRDGDALQCLREESWHATEGKRRWSSATVDLEIVADRDLVPADEVGVTLATVRDVPTSFDPELRSYSWRETARLTCTVENPDSRRVGEHDPMAALGGG